MSTSILMCWLEWRGGASMFSVRFRSFKNIGSVADACRRARFLCKVFLVIHQRSQSRHLSNKMPIKIAKPSIQFILYSFISFFLLTTYASLNLSFFENLVSFWSEVTKKWATSVTMDKFLAIIIRFRWFLLSEPILM